MPTRDEILAELQRWANDPTLIDDDLRAKTLIAKIHREGGKSVRAREKAARQKRDQEKLEARADGETIWVENGQKCALCRHYFREVHPHYARLCPTCAHLNWEKRHSRGDLRGQIALVTGGRIRIGFELALKLLRDGARVLTTTRFEKNCRARFEAQPDFAVWGDRLEIHTLDFCDVRRLENWCDEQATRLPHLDILVNNAAQTVARPPIFYERLLGKNHELPPSANALANVGEEFFPLGQWDADGEPLDLRPQNSWVLSLGEIESLEAAQSFVVGALAPMILTARLRSLLQKSPLGRRFVINVAAREGRFAGESKTQLHPHTNMSKAALHMLTRTVAQDLRRDNIFCNAVDPGWVSDQNPFPKAQRMRAQGFLPPLDAIDGAARLYAPILEGLQNEAEPVWGVLLKNFETVEW